MQTYIQTLKISVAGFALIWFCAMQLAGQISPATATLVGTVTDASGAVVPDATVAAVNVATNLKTVVKCDSVGNYVISMLSPGTYAVDVEKAGFKTVVRRGVVLNVAQTVRADFTLEPGAVTQTVSVTSTQTLVQTETSTLATVVSNVAVAQLPLNGRNFVQLVQITPGANGGPPGSTSGSPSLNGMTVESTGYYLDGAEDTELFQHHPAVRPPVDAIQEFTVQTELPPAEYGTESAGIVNVITKSGTNKLHGDAWEFLRNDALDARSFFDVNRPILRQNQFGGTLGGPVFIPKVYNGKNRTFFFFSYEGTRVNTAKTFLNTVPTAAMKAGDFSGFLPTVQLYNPLAVNAGTGLRTPFAGNVIPSDLINPTSAKIAALYPNPSRPAANPLQPANNYVLPLPTDESTNNYLGKVDEDFSSRDRLFARFELTNDVTPFPGIIPLGDASFSLDGRNLALGYTHIFDPHLMNEFTFSLDVFNQISGPSTLLPNFNQQYGFASTQPGVPNIAIEGITGLLANPSTTGLASAALILDLPYTSYDLSDDLTFVRGNHSLKFGFGNTRARMNTLLANPGDGSRDFSGDFTRQIGTAPNSFEARAMGDFLLGLATSAGGLQLNLAAARFDPRFSFYHAYAQDNWKATRHLTLNLGVRYDLFLPPISATGTGAAYFNFDTGQLIYPANAKKNFPSWCCSWGYGFENSNRLYQGTYDNFAPRVGFAYRMGSSDRTAIRGGYGMFYDPGLLNVAFNNSQAPPSFSNVELTASPDETNPANFIPITVNVAPSNVPIEAPVGFKAYTQHEDTGVMQQWSLSVERQFLSNTLFDVSYVGWRSYHFMTDNIINMPPPGSGNPQLRRPYPLFGSAIVQMPWAFADYNGLNVSLQHRFGKSLTYLAGYSWGHSLGNALAENGNDVEVSHKQRAYGEDQSLEYGPNSWDIRHRFVFSGVYALPFGSSLRGVAKEILAGWQLSGIYTFQTGWPVTATAFGNPSNRDGRSVTYANATGLLPNLPNGLRTPQHWFNTAAFVAPAPYSYGDAGPGTIRTDGINNVDFMLGKEFKLGESRSLQFRSEYFNLFNRPEFGVPNTAVGSPTYGQVLNTFNTGREIQFALKFFF